MWQKIKNLYHLAQAFLAAVCFRFPTKKLSVIGVTGTDGKTTTVNMIHHILESENLKTSMISSVNAQIGEESFDTGFHVSTPNPWQVQKYLKQAADAGSKYFVLEATSHGLDQNRLAFINFEVGVVTNITHEHLDYHKTWENYVKAKSKLLKNSKTAVLNSDDKFFDHLKSKAEGKVITYGEKSNADFNLKNTEIKLKIIGTYNMQNALAAVAAVVSTGVKKEKAISALRSFSGVKGRMEEINSGQDFKVFVDFAHTPNGMEQVLKTLQSTIKDRQSGKLIVVFGAAARRDKSKRPLMGAVAARLADISVLTAEDPRSENPREICGQITKGMKGKKENQDYHIILDRKKAIEFAIKLAKKGDIVAILGKGHEKSMNINGRELPWDEQQAARDAILENLNG